MKQIGRPFALAITAATAAGLLVLHACEEPDEITQPSTATAAVQYRLTVSGLGTGNGVVTSSPAGINCIITAGTAGSSGCSTLYNSGTTVTLTPKPAAGHAFGGWVKHCVGTGPCVLKMDISRSLSAEFRKGPFTIKITNATGSTGSGTVKSQTGLSPVINCVITNGTPGSSGCSQNYPANTVVTLSATAASGNFFDGWRTAGCGTGTCRVTAIQSMTIPSAFSRASASRPDSAGRWEPVFTTPVVGVHVHVLRTGKVLLWGDSGNPQIWNPAGGFISVPDP